MVLCWLLVRQEHARVMVKLDQDNGTLDTEVERVIFAKASDPAKVCFFKVLFDLFKLELARL
jgi:hypothetical protein